MTATLAAAKKLASEDTALVDEDEEVWLWPRTPGLGCRGWGGGTDEE